MQPSKISWANLVEMKFNDSFSKWPKLNTTTVKKQNKTNQNNLIHSDNILNRTLWQNLNTNNDISEITTKLENINVVEKENDKEENLKFQEQSREEIIKNRKIRKTLQKEEKAKKALEDKINAIREPKSEKLKIIDQKLFEKIKISDIEINPSNQITSRNRFKKKIQMKSINVNLNDLIKEKPLKNKDRIIQNKRKTVIQKRKGKTREFPKKSQTTFKKKILLIRKIKQELLLNKKQEEIENSNKEIIINSNQIKHSRKFRPYCDHFITNEICKNLEKIIFDLFRFQKRAYDKNEIKARAHKRYVVGFKETEKSLKKIKLLIIAPDLEPNTVIDNMVEELKCSAQKLEIPYVFGCHRRKIGFLLHKGGPVSCMGVIDYDGTVENVKNLLHLIDIEKENYKKLLIESKK